jgi:DNA repair protein RecO (recombination protein O)
MLAVGKGLDVVTGCQILNPSIPLREDLVYQARGFYLMELIDNFCPEGLENRALFSLLVDTLEHLCLSEGGERVLRRFEVRLLDITGFRPELHRCLGCHQALEPVTNYLSLSAGGLLCPPCAPEQPPVHSLSVNAVKVLRLLQEADMETVNRLKLAPGLAAELEAALKGYIQFVLERRIKSGVWLERLRRELGPNGSLGGPQNGR